MATVLVVDDRAVNREVTRATLELRGHQVIEAARAAEALSLARTSPPDVVVADVLMPGMDGYELLRLLRTNASTALIPVLLYTANYSPAEAAPLARAYGAARLLVKSGDPDELLAAVEEALRGEPPRPLDPLDPDATARHLHTLNAKLVDKVRELDASQRQLATVAELSPVGIAIGGADGHASYVNPRLCALTGRRAPELLGAGWLALAEPGQRAAILAAGGPDEIRHDLLDSGGDGGARARHLSLTTRRLYGEDGARIGFIAALDDVTELVQAEERRHAEQRARDEQDRRQLAEKFDSLVRMSGGVAHDFNNLLNVILSFAEFAVEGVREATGGPLGAERADAIVRDLEQIDRAGKRAAHLTHQLLVFGGRDLVKPRVVDPNRTVAEVCGLLASTVGQHVTIGTELAPDLKRVVADGDQLCQVLINLAVNARDAMPHGGRLLFRTANAREVPQAAYPVEQPAGEFVEIAVIDDGAGMPEEVQRRAVEPFFTTKPRGRGTGLGLATAFGTMRQAGGHLAIESAVGAGTTVRLFLPATDEPVEGAGPVPDPPRAAGQTILVAEDEDGVRAVAERVLTGAGYRVLAAVNGADALAVAQRHGERIDAVLTDVVMPRLDGPSFVRELRRTHPDVPVLYMSGYAAPLMTEQGVVEPGVSVLSKPFTSAQLLGAVQALLAAGRPG